MERERMLIEADELLKKLHDKNVRIYDAAINNNQYLQGHIPGAAFFDHGTFSAPNAKYEYTLLPDSALATQIGEIGISHDTEVIFYAWGMLPFATRAWWMLRYAGHENVRVFNGGLAAWRDAGGILEEETRIYEPCVFEGRFRSDMFVDKKAVMDAMNDADVATIDVLPMVSYEAAHITGSTCLPCLKLMQDMDSFLPNDVLAQRLKETPRSKQIITYCGGGIAATVNAMAHLMAGQENVAVYDGSMMEWVGEGMPVTGDGKWAIWEQE